MFLEILTWVILVTLWIGAFVGLIYPILPSAVFLYGSYFVYGFMVSFESFSTFFWIIQTSFFVLLFVVDYVANALGVKKYGGTKASMWGSTIGLLVGPFIIPFAGIILGPFIGAIIAEIVVHKTPFNQALRIGFGSVVGLIGSVLVKGLIMLGMLVYFLIQVL